VRRETDHHHPVHTRRQRGPYLGRRRRHQRVRRSAPGACHAAPEQLSSGECYSLTWREPCSTYSRPLSTSFLDSCCALGCATSPKLTFRTSTATNASTACTSASRLRTG